MNPSRIDPALWPLLRSGAYMAKPLPIEKVGEVMASQEPTFAPLYVESVTAHGRGILNERVAERPHGKPHKTPY